MKTPIGILALFVFICSCTNNQKTESPEKKPEVKADYFPVQEYLLGEIVQVDSLPVGIMKKVTVNNKKDSGFIQRPEFKQLANAFISPELQKSFFEENYTETSFADETTGYLTFTYQPKNEKPLITRIDVLARPGTSSAKVQSVYMEKKYLKNDTLCQEKLYWKSNSSFWIRKEKTYKEQTSGIEHLEVIWNPEEY